MTPHKAHNKQCRICTNNQPRLIAACTSTSCPAYPYRMGSAIPKRPCPHCRPSPFTVMNAWAGRASPGIAPIPPAPTGHTAKDTIPSYWGEARGRPTVEGSSQATTPIPGPRNGDRGRPLGECASAPVVASAGLCGGLGRHPHDWSPCLSWVVGVMVGVGAFLPASLGHRPGPALPPRPRRGPPVCLTVACRIPAASTPAKRRRQSSAMKASGFAPGTAGRADPHSPRGLPWSSSLRGCAGAGGGQR